MSNHDNIICHCLFVYIHPTSHIHPKLTLCRLSQTTPTASFPTINQLSGSDRQATGSSMSMLDDCVKDYQGGAEHPVTLLHLLQEHPLTVAAGVVMAAVMTKMTASAMTVPTTSTTTPQQLNPIMPALGMSL
jgi:hypothetical protein